MAQPQQLKFKLTIDGNEFLMEGYSIAELKPELTRWFETLAMVQQARIDALTLQLKQQNDTLAADVAANQP